MIMGASIRLRGGRLKGGVEDLFEGRVAAGNGEGRGRPEIC
jgi:hypothetical protein